MAGAARKGGITKSHPVWVRGLKQSCLNRYSAQHQSHPVWVRGLKLEMQIDQHVLNFVAPRVGAWIETLFVILSGAGVRVAPRLGAWIETNGRSNSYRYI